MIQLHALASYQVEENLNSNLLSFHTASLTTERCLSLSWLVCVGLVFVALQKKTSSNP